MKTTAFIAALALLGAAAPALADGHTDTSAAPMEKLTINSSIEELMANEKSSAILEKHLPGIGSHSAYNQFKGMSLPELQPWSGGLVTDEIIAAVTKDLAQLG